MATAQIDPDSYRWLSGGPLGEAGCLTVIVDADIESAATAFGCEPVTGRLVTFSRAGGASDPDMVGLSAWVGHTTDGAAIVVEDNGFQGSRPEVLRPASRKASRAGVAASLFWNVNGVVIFTASRRGKVVCATELVGAEISEVPRVLRRLAARLEDDDTDLVGVGAAMVEQYTGVRVSADDLGEAVYRTLTPPPEAFTAYGPDHASLQVGAPELVPPIVALSPGRQRSLAALAARAAAAEADVSTLVPVRELLAQIDNVPAGVAGPSVLPPALSPLVSRWEREQTQWSNEHQDWTVNKSSGAVEGSLLMGRVWASRALRVTSHPDALEAALQATFNALWTFYCTSTRRPHERDGSGSYERSEGRGDRLPDRAQAFRELLADMVAEPDSDWDQMVTKRIPRPFSTDERGGFIRADQFLEDSGAFDHWN